MASLADIRQLAERAHEGQIDPDGVPHVEHIQRVAEAVHGFEETAVALLHDILEDTRVNASALRAMQIPADVLEAVELLTRKDGSPYRAYIERIAGGTGHAARLARAVKVADLKDNLRRSEAAGDRTRIAKYRPALEPDDSGPGGAAASEPRAKMALNEGLSDRSRS